MCCLNAISCDRRINIFGINFSYRQREYVGHPHISTPVYDKLEYMKKKAKYDTKLVKMYFFWNKKNQQDFIFAFRWNYKDITGIQRGHKNPKGYNAN